MKQSDIENGVFFVGDLPIPLIFELHKFWVKVMILQTTGEVMHVLIMNVLKGMVLLREMKKWPHSQFLKDDTTKGLEGRFWEWGSSIF